MEYSVVSAKGQIVIPKTLRKKYGIMPRTKVAFIDREGELILKVMTKEYFDSFASILKGDVIGELMTEKRIEKKS